MANLTIDIMNMPEALWSIRREMAQLLRGHADAEISVRVAARLREIATEFEVGSRT